MSERATRILIVAGVLVIAVLAVVIAIIAVDGGGEPEAQPSYTTLAAPGSSTLPPTTAPPTTTATTVPPSSTSAAPTTSSTTSTSTTTTSTTTTTTVAVACPGPGTSIPPGSTEVAQTLGDFDGDGALDRFLVYQAGGNFFARVELAYGWTSEAVAYGPGVVEARTTYLGGPADIPIVVSITTPQSRTATFYAMFGCALDEIPLDGGGTAQFPLESGVMGKTGVTCNADGVTTSRAAVAGDMSGDEWEVSGTDYFWAPGLGELQATASSIALLPFVGNEASIDAAATFGC